MMKKIFLLRLQAFLFAVIFAVTFFSGQKAQAQISPYWGWLMQQPIHYTIPIGDLPFRCKLPNGNLVGIYMDNNLPQIGLAIPSPFPSNFGANIAFIVLNAHVLNQWPSRAAAAMFYHECGHALDMFDGALPMPSVAAEDSADCYASRRMARRGLIKGEFDFADIEKIFANFPSSQHHRSGVERVQHMRFCYRNESIQQ